MTAQLDLAFHGPRARRRDPASSHRAAAEAERFAASQAARVLRLIVANPGLTAKQLGALGVMDRYAIARRAGELEEGGWISNRGDVTPPGEDYRLMPTRKAVAWAECAKRAP